MTCLTVMEYLCYKWPKICFTCNTSRSFPHSWLVTGFVTILTRRVSLVEQELLTLREHLCSPPVFSGVRVTRSLVLYVCFVDRLYFCPFSVAIVLSVLPRYTDADIGCTRRRQAKQKHNTICVGHHYAQTYTNNVNKTWALLQTTRGKDEPNSGYFNGHHNTERRT